MTIDTKAAILAAAKRTAMARGYGGLNFRDLAAEVGVKAPSLYHYFPTKADLGAAVARRYHEDLGNTLAAMAASAPDPIGALRRYPDIFRASLASDNRMCLASFMAAEHDDLPEPVRTEVKAFAEVNVAWLAALLADAAVTPPAKAPARARAIYAAVAGAQLYARSRADITLFDAMIDSYREAGLLPA